MCARFPITTAVGLAAIAVSCAWFLHITPDWAFMDGRTWHGEPWRLVASALPHVDIFHIYFNLYWLWAFGTRVEQALGKVAYTAILLLFAAGSAAADYALAQGGVGLSGVGYGLCGLLWVLQKHDTRFARTVDASTVKLFAGWFVLCCVLTQFGVWKVANVAHAAGAVLGVLLGAAMVARGIRRVAFCAGLTGFVVLSLVGGSVARPYVNMTGAVAIEMADRGIEELEKNHEEAGRRLLREAVRRNPNLAYAWYDLAIAEARLNNTPAAIEALRKTLALDRDQPEAARFLRQLESGGVEPGGQSGSAP